MRRWTARRLGAWAILAVTIVGVGGLVTIVAPRWWSGEGGTYAPPSPAVSTRIEPASALFGDVITARASILVDTRAIDGDEAVLYGRFAPYRVVSTARSVKRHVGHAARIDYAFRLQCLTAACLEAMEREGTDGRPITTPIAFAPALLRAETPDGAAVDEEVRWPAVVVRSRLSPADVATGEPRPPRLRMPAATYRIAPGTLGWVLIGAACALALVGGVLFATAVRGRVAARRLRVPAHLTPIERALALARHASAHGDTAGERRALERLAAELRRSGDGELTAAVRRLAWSKDEPSDQALEALAGELVRTDDAR